MYFKQFPKIGYSFDFSERGTLTAVTNIFSRFKLNESVLDNALAFYKYQYENGDTPEIVSFKQYGDGQYHWIISAVNQVLDPLFEYPLQQDALERKIIKQYGYSSIANSYSTIHHYELEVEKILTEVDGPTTSDIMVNIITLDQYNYASNTLVLNFPGNSTTRTYHFHANNSNVATANTSSLTVTDTYKEVYVYDYELELNENRRQIKILKPEYIQPIVSELERILND